MVLTIVNFYINGHYRMHCFFFSGSGNDILKASSLKVTLAQHDLTKESTDAYEMAVKTVTVHSEYSCNKVKNDIAILELEKEVIWSERLVFSYHLKYHLIS